MKGAMTAWGHGLEGIQRKTDSWRISIKNTVLSWEWQDTFGEIEIQEMASHGSQGKFKA